MNKAIKTILIISIAVFGSLTMANSVQAVPPLDVDFEKTPLFSEANFLPGDTVTRWVRVTNNTGEDKEIGVKVINDFDPNGLGDHLNIKIKEGDDTHYENTLTQFFSETDGIPLSTLTNEQNTQYDFSITFFPETGNDYQGKSLGFDLEIGYFEEEGGGEGGQTLTTFGGGGVAILGLNIFDEKLDDVSQNSATITWRTNLDATSQIIYSSENESHNFDHNNPPYFGYAHVYPEPEDSTLKTGHNLTIPNLEQCTTYYYRIVARTSPG
ncbi:unnamed protein product, partial [marine sediment metagenome]